MSKFKPYGDYVVIELCEKETATEAGIIYESKRDILWLKGKVLSIGRGIKDEKGHVFPSDFKVDDYVMFDKRHYGVESYEGLAVVNIRSVVAIVDKDIKIS